MIESVPSETIFAAFVGGLTVLAALLGNSTTPESPLNRPLLWIMNGVTALALLASGVVSVPNVLFHKQ